MNQSLEHLKGLHPEVDYQSLMAKLHQESHPRRKLKELQNKGYLLRLKKGFYVFTPSFIGRNYSSAIVANLLYGPSYLSLEWALSFYQLIPERVEVYTSVTSQKNKNFETPIGHFSYKHLSLALYPLGVRLQKTEDGRAFLMATPEKALMDLFVLKFKNSEAPTLKEIPTALFEDLRLDLQVFKSLVAKKNLLQMVPHYKYRRWNKLVLDYLLENL